MVLEKRFFDLLTDQHLGHANKASPGSCAQLYIECPSGSDQLLNYFNNHNGGLGQVDISLKISLILTT